MPKDDQNIDLEKLKTDPIMWMRLAMPQENSDVFGNVFTGKENPFEKDSKAAMEKVKKLASEGKLYMREFGRSRHFNKVEMDGDALKLGKQHEVKLSNGSADPILGTLMRVSRSYFKWIGMERVSNWFDKRVQQRDVIVELESQYKKEYKTLSKEQKKELDVIRKQEKLEKELEQIRQKLDQIRGVDTSKRKGEMDAPLNQPPEVEQKNNTMQPTRMGDQPVEEKKEIQPPRANKFVQETVAQQEFIAEKKEVQPTRANKFVQETGAQQEFVAEKKEVQPTRANKFVQETAAQQEFIAEKQEIHQTVQEEVKLEENVQVVQPVEPPKAEQPAAEPEVKEEVKQEVPLINQEEIPQNTAENAEIDLAELEQIVTKTAVQGEVEKEMPAPLNDPPKVEADKGTIQERPKDQGQMTLQERLAAAKEAMDTVENWKEHMSNSLFSDKENRYYNMIKDQKAASDEYMTGAVCGILAECATNQNANRQMIGNLLDGKPMGTGSNRLVNDGIATYNDAMSRKMEGSNMRMENMLANAIRVLSNQAAQETTLSPRLVMIGKMISNAAKFAYNGNMDIPLSEKEMVVARGAVTLAKVAKKHHEAQQYLGKEPMDIASQEGRRSVRDLLMGGAVEKMIQQDKRLGLSITSTQLLMGEGLWSLKNLRDFTNESATRRGIDQEQVREIMEKPNSLKTLGTMKSVGDHIVKASQEVQAEIDKAYEKELEVGQQKEPERSPVQMFG